MDLRFRHPAFTGVAFVALTALFLYLFYEPHHSGPDERFLDHLFTEMTVAAHAIQAEAVERRERCLGERGHGVGIPRQGAGAPGGVEDRSHARSSFQPFSVHCSM